MPCCTIIQINLSHAFSITSPVSTIIKVYFNICIYKVCNTIASVLSIVALPIRIRTIQTNVYNASTIHTTISKGRTKNCSFIITSTNNISISIFYNIDIYGTKLFASKLASSINCSTRNTSGINIATTNFYQTRVCTKNFAGTTRKIKIY